MPSGARSHEPAMRSRTLTCEGLPVGPAESYRAVACRSPVAGLRHPRDDHRSARCRASRARFERDLQGIGQRSKRRALGDQAGAARIRQHGAERRPRGPVPRPCLVDLPGRCRRELGEGDHRDTSAGTAAVARVFRFRRSGHGSQREVQDVARGHQGQRAIIPRQRRVRSASKSTGARSWQSYFT